MLLRLISRSLLRGSWHLTRLPRRLPRLLGARPSTALDERRRSSGVCLSSNYITNGAPMQCLPGGRDGRRAGSPRVPGGAPGGDPELAGLEVSARRAKTS